MFEDYTEEQVNVIAQETPKTGVGLIEYRKYVWALKFTNQRVEKLKKYRQEVLAEIDDEIFKKESIAQNIKSSIQNAMTFDDSIDSTKTGGKSMKLPDVATVSLTTPKDRVDIFEPARVLQELGNDFSKVKVSLYVSKAKKHILETKTPVKGSEIITNYRDLRISFK